MENTIASSQRSWRIPIVAGASVMAIGIVMASLFLPLPYTWSEGWRGALLDRLHAPLMAALTLALFACLRAIGLRWGMSHVFAAGLGLISVGGTELIQPWFGRNCSMQDLAWGSLGVLAANACLFASHFRSLRLRVTGWIVSGLLAVSASLWWFAQAMYAQAETDRNFPSLTDLSDRLAPFLWTIERTSSAATEVPPDASSSKLAPPLRNGVLTLERGASYCLSAHFDARGSDWSDFAGLELSSECESTVPIELGLRLDTDNAQQPRTRAGTRVLPGSHGVRILWPTDPTPPRRVHELVLFVAPGNPEARLKLSGLRLLPREQPVTQ